MAVHRFVRRWLGSKEHRSKSPRIWSFSGYQYILCFFPMKGRSTYSDCNVHFFLPAFHFFLNFDSTNSKQLLLPFDNMRSRRNLLHNVWSLRTCLFFTIGTFLLCAGGVFFMSIPSPNTLFKIFTLCNFFHFCCSKKMESTEFLHGHYVLSSALEPVTCWCCWHYSEPQHLSTWGVTTSHLCPLGSVCRAVRILE